MILVVLSMVARAQTYSALEVGIGCFLSFFHQKSEGRAMHVFPRK